MNEQNLCEEVFINRDEFTRSIYSFVNPHNKMSCLLSHASCIPGYGGILYKGFSGCTFKQAYKSVEGGDVIAIPLKVRFLKFMLSRPKR